MKLLDIDKNLYRKRLNIVIVASIICLTILSILFGAILIALFGDALPIADAVTGEKTSNFRFNFVGVVFALLTCLSILQALKNIPFFHEIYYVWKLKQIQNIIYRRLKNIKAATKERDPIDINAFIVLNYYYTSLKQVYTLDNNTLTMSSLSTKVKKLQELMDSLNIDVSTETFERPMLINYR